MSTDLATRSTNGLAPVMLDPAVQEKVVIYGDLSKLDPAQKLNYYKARCDAAGLDIRTRPFEYINLQGKLVLYATKSCTDSLTAIHGLSVAIVNHRRDGETDLYIAEARASTPAGRHTDDIGVVPVAGLRPADLANAMMKAVTKAKRRAVLSLCGLGDMMDESELETVDGLRRCDDRGELQKPQNNSGYGQGMYASPEQSEAFEKAMKGFLAKVNNEWLDRLDRLCRGDVPEQIRELNEYQADAHLLKWAVETGRLDRAIVPEDAKVRQRYRFTAIVYHRTKDDRKAITQELARYAEQHWHRQLDALTRLRPDLAEAINGQFGEPEDQAEDAADPEFDYEPGSNG